MKINSVSSVSFGKKAYTKNGNEYEKTNKYKIIGTGSGVAGAALSINFTKILSRVFDYPMEHVVPKKMLYLDAIMALVSGVGGGILLDNAKNKKRALKADSAR